MLDSTLTVPNYRVGNFKSYKLFCYLKFLKIFEKISKIVLSRFLQALYLDDSGIQNWRQNSQPLIRFLGCLIQTR